MRIFDIILFGIHIAPTYYGLAYAVGFFSGYYLLVRRGRIATDLYDRLFVWIILGGVLGGRIGYILMYDLPYYLAHPAEMLYTWHGGMSFHGGIIGTCLVLLAFAWRHRTDFWALADDVASVAPIGIGLGRIGNYINRELLGYAPYTGPLAVERGGQHYFPSPLLEAGLEGILLFFIVQYALSVRRSYGQVAGVFLVAYGTFRILAELVRMPDAQIGYLFGTSFITMGQILSLPLVIGGIIVLLVVKNRRLDPVGG